MKNRDLFGWMVVGVNWYTILVVGGIINLVSGILQRIHDLWLLIRREKNEHKYFISKSPKKLLISCITLFLGIIINIMTILLVMPFLMGLQHLMRTSLNKTHKTAYSGESSFRDGKKWYDGIIYSAGIDPGLKDAREIIHGLVSDNSQVIDICCGTGELVFSLANKCDRVFGVDHSSKMISYAKKEKTNRGLANVDFSHANAMNLSKFQKNEFDLSVLSLTLHEMPPSIRGAVLKEAKRISKQIIILDYKIPAPMNRNGIIALFFEFVAGYDHLKHYLHYRDKGGLDYILSKAGLKRESEIIAQKGTLEIVNVS
jgi:ubiquinone/menaquinone biosynthesis C-methylase UbiE